MSVDYDASTGFGYKISREKWSESNLNPEDLDGNHSAQLPDGFKYFQYGSAYIDNGEGIVICFKGNLSLILRGEEPLPDCSPILEWAKKHNILFENDKPELYTELYIF
jgi:hypothetical protein